MKKGMHYGIGMISVFMIFVVLSFTMLAVISFINGMDENTISIKQASYVEEFYEADAKAKVIMAKLEDSNQEEKMYLLNENSIEKTDDFYRYSIDVNNKVILEVELFENGDVLEVVEWATKSK